MVDGNTVTVKWGEIEQWGNIKQSYLFHGNSLNSVYNSHVARCFWFKLVTGRFQPPTHQISKYPPRPSTLFFCLNNSFQMEKFDALRWSFDRKSPNFSHPICLARDTQKHLFDLHMSQIFTVLTSEQYDGKNFRKFGVARVIF